MQFYRERIGTLLLVLLFCVDALEIVLRQVSMVTFLSVHNCGILWFKAWSVEPPCKIHLLLKSFNGEYLFGEFLDTFMKKVTWGRNTSTLKK